MRAFIVALAAALLSLPGTGRAETLYFIHVDHLGTPRLAIGEDGVERWRWDNLEPFGDNAPIETMGTEGYLINLPLRFPGQYADKETGLAYNMARDYASDTGRYIQSDPIGLVGGINTYVYVLDPLTQIDPEGLMGRAPGTFGKPGVPSNPATPSAPATPAALCDGRWIRVNWTRDPFFIVTLDCTCYWSCYSCPGKGSDAFPDPNPGQYSTKGKLVFSGQYGKNFSPKKGDECICPKPGEEKGCAPCKN